MSIFENLYYGNICLNEHNLLNGGNNNELIENAVRLESELSAVLTERQKILFEKLQTADLIKTAIFSRKLPFLVRITGVEPAPSCPD